MRETGTIIIIIIAALNRGTTSSYKRVKEGGGREGKGGIREGRVHLFVDQKSSQ